MSDLPSRLREMALNLTTGPISSALFEAADALEYRPIADEITDMPRHSMDYPDPKMRFTSAVGPWHRWFAWRPVTTYDQRLVWLRMVGRRCMQKHQHLDGGPDFSWQYALEE